MAVLTRWGHSRTGGRMRPDPLIRRTRISPPPAETMRTGEDGERGLASRCPPVADAKPQPDIPRGQHGTGREPPIARSSGRAKRQTGLPAKSAEGGVPPAAAPLTPEAQSTPVAQSRRRGKEGGEGSFRDHASSPPSTPRVTSPGQLIALPRYGEMEKRFDRRIRESLAQPEI